VGLSFCWAIADIQDKRNKRHAVFFTGVILVKIEFVSGDANKYDFHKNKFLWNTRLLPSQFQNLNHGYEENFSGRHA
jgi:hypothetical protein